MEGREWELGLLACLTKNPAYLRFYADHLTEKHFSDPLTHKYLRIFKAAYKAHGRLPTMPEMRKLVQKLTVVEDKSSRTEVARQMLADAREIYEMEISDVTRDAIEEFISRAELEDIKTQIARADLSGENRLVFLEQVRTRVDRCSRLSGSYQNEGCFILRPEMIDQTLDALENISAYGYRTTGIPRLDDRIGGFGPGEFSCFIGPVSRGKAQPLWSKLLTSQGWATMGEAQVGMGVVDQEGRPCHITGVFPQGSMPVYELTFSDGTKAHSCDEHLWVVRRIDDKQGHFSTRQLKEFRAKVATRKHGGSNYQIPLCKAVDLPIRVLPLDPYLLGCLLGNGGLSGTTVKFSSGNAEQVARVKELLPSDVELRFDSGVDYRIADVKGRKNSLLRALESLGLRKLRAAGKFMPPCYLWAGPEQRLALLQGLMDTDGHVGEFKASRVDYVSASLALVEGVEFIVRSLGGSAHRIQSKWVNGIEYARTTFRLDVCPFRLTRKANVWKPARRSRGLKSILSVEFIGHHECQCIMVDSPSHTYLTDDFTVTHNTALLVNVGAANLEAGERVLHVSLDEPEMQIRKRYLTRLSGIPGKAHASRDQMKQALKHLEQYMDNLLIWSMPNEAVTTKDIQTFIEQKQEVIYYLDRRRGVEESKCGKFGKVLVDYATKTKMWMGKAKGGSESWDRIYYTSEEHQQLAKTLDIPVTSALQGNKDMAMNEIGQLTSVAMGYAGVRALTNALIIGQLNDDLHSQPGRLWLYGAKTRTEESLFLVPVLYDKSRQLVWDDIDTDVDYIDSTTSKHAKPKNYYSEEKKAARNRDEAPKNVKENPDYDPSSYEDVVKTGQRTKSWRSKGMASAMEDE